MNRFDRVLVATLVALVCTTGIMADEPSDPETASKKQEDAIEQIDGMIASADVDKSAAQWRTQLPKPEQASFDSERSYYMNLTTSKGDIRIKFLPDVAPMHVTSFIYLTRLGFFDDLIFHRVITQFMAQGGCPLGRGTGGPGYEYDGEFSATVKHNRPYLLSMANRGRGTDGSQFFLTFVETPHLDGKHTIFGEVVDGQKVVDALEKAGSRSGATREKLEMKKSTIEVKAKRKD